MDNLSFERSLEHYQATVTQRLATPVYRNPCPSCQPSRLQLGGEGGRGRVCGCQRAAAVDISSSAPSRAQRQQHEDRSLGHRLRHTTGPTRPHPFRTHATHPHDVGKSPTSFTERPGHRNVRARLGCAAVFAGTGLDPNHVPGGLLQRPGADAR